MLKDARRRPWHPPRWNSLVEFGRTLRQHLPVGPRWLSALLQDIRYALQALNRYRASSLGIVATMALGMGAVTTMYSAVHAALVRPLPFPEPDALVVLYGVRVGLAPGSGSDEALPWLDLQALAAMHDVFSEVAVYAPGGLNIDGTDSPERVSVGVVTTSFFAIFGASPVMGRAFSADEGQPGGPDVAVLSYALWRRRFGGASVVGKSVSLNSRPYEIVGVMPPGFAFPDGAQLWLPLTVPATSRTLEPFGSGTGPQVTVARLRSGVDYQSARRRLQDVWLRMVPGSPLAAITHNPLTSLRDSLLGDHRQVLLLLLVATGLLLLVACVNATSLLLVRTSKRSREIAVRAILGATPGRIVGQLVAESLVLSLSGALLGLLVAYGGLGVARALLPPAITAVSRVAVDLPVLGFAVLLALVAGAAVGLWPALSAVRAEPIEALRTGGPGSTVSGGRARRVLIGAELAVALTLVSGAGLMLRSLGALLRVDTGFQTKNVSLAQLSYPRAMEPASEFSSLVRILDRLQAIPGVLDAGVISDPPGRLGGVITSVEPEPLGGHRSSTTAFARYLQASAGYFRALGIPLLRGRLMTTLDDAQSPHIAVINATMANQLWPGEDPVGKRVFDVPPPTFRPRSPSARSAALNPTVFRTVIGVVGDTRDLGVEHQPLSTIFVPVFEQPPLNVTVVARASADAPFQLPYLRQAVHDAAPSQAVYDLRTMDDVLSSSLSARRMSIELITSFGLLGLLLAVAGVYGTVAYAVAQRMREFGIRSALGATGGDLMRAAGGEMLWVVLGGLAVGLGSTYALTSWLRALLYGVRPHDAFSLTAALLLLLTSVAAAIVVPARRAAQASPLAVVRAE